MKLTLKTLFILLFVFSTQIHAVDYEKQTFMTVEEYPYQQLVRLSDKVLIHFTDFENEVKCKVEVQHNGDNREFTEMIVTHKAFTKDALRACFNRSEATKTLMWVFNNR